MDFNHRLDSTFTFEELSALPLELQNEKLKQRIIEIEFDNKELLRHIGFLQSQISKYSDLLYLQQISFVDNLT